MARSVGGCGLGTSDAMVDTFQERQKELCFLSSFIEEHEKWLDGLLCQLGWTRDRLSGKVESFSTSMHDITLFS